MSYEIKLDIFEGPLDLLLYLIRKNEIDIYNIPIALITEQYLAYLEMMRSLNLDLAGEYLVLASTLIHIKSKLLLPPDESEGEEEEGEDPRAELVQQLLEYQIFKEAALRLENRPLLERDVFTRGAPGEAPSAAEEEGEAMIEVGVFELVAAFRRIIAGFDRPEELEIDAEKMSMTDRINEIMEMLSEKQQMTFVELIGDRTDRRWIICTFLAILELMKLRMIRAYQSGPFGAIRLFLAVEE
ncbi:MAG: segregation/condensation protein A [Proteobacteria bacterium]|nr:segregation/condensation protein A [Pseudomonadota bacterium]MBU2252982.1 segregation/condensation protein A [Pseudomonadota bacterium]